MIKIKDEAERWSDSRLNGHDTSAFIKGAKFVCECLYNEMRERLEYLELQKQTEEIVS